MSELVSISEAARRLSEGPGRPWTTKRLRRFLVGAEARTGRTLFVRVGTGAVSPRHLVHWPELKRTCPELFDHHRHELERAVHAGTARLAERIAQLEDTVERQSRLIGVLTDAVRTLRRPR